MDKEVREAVDKLDAINYAWRAGHTGAHKRIGGEKEHVKEAQKIRKARLNKWKKKQDMGFSVDGKRCKAILDGLGHPKDLDGDVAYNAIADVVNSLDAIKYPWDGDSWKAYKKVAAPLHQVDAAQKVRGARLKKNRK